MLKGGIADKLGNSYEALWTLIEALRVLRGHADEIRVEPFNEDAEGLEFRITTGSRWQLASVQAAAAGRELDTQSSRGRGCTFGVYAEAR